MKTILELWHGIQSLFSEESPPGSRKLELALLGLTLCLIAPEIALGVGILTAGYCVGQGIVDAKK